MADKTRYIEVTRYFIGKSQAVRPAENKIRAMTADKAYQQ